MSDERIWYPAPLGLRGSQLADWVRAISQAEGQCQCNQGDCGKKHKGGRCAHVHGQYQDKVKQYMCVMPNGEVLCQTCVRGMENAYKREVKKLKQEEELF